MRSSPTSLSRHYKLFLLLFPLSPLPVRPTLSPIDPDTSASASTSAEPSKKRKSKGKKAAGDLEREASPDIPVPPEYDPTLFPGASEGGRPPTQAQRSQQGFPYGGANARASPPTISRATNATPVATIGDQTDDENDEENDNDDDSGTLPNISVVIPKSVPTVSTGTSGETAKGAALSKKNPRSDAPGGSHAPLDADQGESQACEAPVRTLLHLQSHSRKGGEWELMSTFPACLPSLFVSQVAQTLSLLCRRWRHRCVPTGRLNATVPRAKNMMMVGVDGSTNLCAVLQ